MLIDIAKNDPDLLAGKTIQQIVAMCGDGQLRDGSSCLTELRQILEMENAEGLSAYARFCVANKFERMAKCWIILSQSDAKQEAFRK